MLSVLRVLLLKKQEPDDWARVKTMMSNWEEVSRQPRVVVGISKITDFLKTELKLDWVEEEDVQHAWGVLRTNAVEVAGGGGRALFPVAAIMSHSCAPCLEVLGVPGQQVLYRARRRIVRGEELTWRYHTFLQPREELQAKLLQEWHFTCCCPR